MNDPIVEEVRRVRDAHAARFHYNLDAIFRDIKDQEKKCCYTFVSGEARVAAPNQAPQPPGTALSVSQDSKSREVAPAAEI